MRVSKNHRIIDKKLLEHVRTLECLHCSVTPCQPHHVRSIGAGGGDILQNLMPLCTEAHTRIHMTGLCAAANKNKGIREWLIDMGWTYDAILLRWNAPF